MSQDELERRRAFVGLLRHPVLDRVRHPELYALVRSSRHRPVLTDWFASRLGYRLVVTDTAARLFLPPSGGVVVAPPRLTPGSRRVPVLALLAAMSAEDAEDVTTTQDLSDRVRLLTGRVEVALAPYDPERFAERQMFVAALQLLVDLGALVRIGREGEEQSEGWAHRRNTVGNAFEVNRAMLLRLIDPLGLEAALAPGPAESHVDGEDNAARFGVMRRLVELPACLLDDLSPGERAYLVNQRHRILMWCEEMTGWTVEQRVEGLALVAGDEADTDLPFPRLRAVDFVALTTLDGLLQSVDDARLTTEERLMAVVADVRMRYPRAMTKELDSDVAVRDRAVELLQGLDLLRPGPRSGTWWLSPAAARYRNPDIVAVTGRLGEETQ
jgi:uncharacterized protein (TIGR02678 family)